MMVKKFWLVMALVFIPKTGIGQVPYDCPVSPNPAVEATGCGISNRLPTCNMVIDSARSGNWNTAGTWVGNRVPGSAEGDCVRINSGHRVIYDVTTLPPYQINQIAVNGELSFSPALNTILKTALLGISDSGNGGTLEIGTAAAPITGSVTIRLSGVKRHCIDRNILPAYVGCNGGLQINKNGNWIAYGGQKLHRVRLASQANAGARSIIVQGNVQVPPNNWAVGDIVFVTGTKSENGVCPTNINDESCLLDENESFAIQSMSLMGGNTTINFSEIRKTNCGPRPSALQYTHLAEGADNPHAWVGNVTRNIRVESASVTLPSHTLVDHEWGVNSPKIIDLNNVEFKNLGVPEGIQVISGATPPSRQKWALHIHGNSNEPGVDRRLIGLAFHNDFSCTQPVGGYGAQLVLHKFRGNLVDDGIVQNVVFYNPVPFAADAHTGSSAALWVKVGSTSETADDTYADKIKINDALIAVDPSNTYVACGAGRNCINTGPFLSAYWPEVRRIEMTGAVVAGGYYGFYPAVMDDPSMCFGMPPTPCDMPKFENNEAYMSFNDNFRFSAFNGQTPPDGTINTIKNCKAFAGTVGYTEDLSSNLAATGLVIKGLTSAGVRSYMRLNDLTIDSAYSALGSVDYGLQMLEPMSNRSIYNNLTFTGAFNLYSTSSAVLFHNRSFFDICGRFSNGRGRLNNPTFNLSPDPRIERNYVLTFECNEFGSTLEVVNYQGDTAAALRTVLGLGANNPVTFRARQRNGVNACSATHGAGWINAPSWFGPVCLKPGLVN